MGPWYHGQWGGREPGDHLGHVKFDAKTSDFYRESIEFPFFEHHLKGAPDPKLPEAYVFQTGTNQWKKARPGPQDGQTRLLLVLLRRQARPRRKPRPTDERTGFDEYVSDPAKPVPSNPNIAIGMTREYMVDDQRFAARPRRPRLPDRAARGRGDPRRPGPCPTSTSRPPGPTPTGSSS